MLDKIPAVYRHAIILFLGATLTYVADQINAVPAQWRPFAAAAVAIATLVVTPLTKQYGVGAANAND